MADSKEPMIKLDPNGKAPILSYNVPEPTSYNGRNFIELRFDDDEKKHQEYFKEIFRTKPSTQQPTVNRNVETTTLRSSVLSAMKSGFNDSQLFSNRGNTYSLYLAKKNDTDAYDVKSNAPISEKFSQIDIDEVTLNIQAGMKLHIFKNLFGTLDFKYIPEKPQHPIVPHLYIVEIYQLTSRLGDYGAGKIIKTYSLLPGEKAKISIKSYLKKQTDSKQSSSILDSFTEESATDFETSLQEENSDKTNFSKTKEYYAEAEGSASWGFGSASAKGGFKSSTNSSREEFAKSVSNAVEKHANKASSKRDVQINTSYEVKEESGEETSIEREIQNINLSRTLNFIFRQMNQEYTSILHLVDVRIAFFNGLPESRVEVPISEMDTLLDKVIIAEKKGEVKNYIVSQLKNIRDLDGVFVPFIEEVASNIGGLEEKYFRVIKQEQKFTKESDTTPAEYKVKGIITSAITSVMRTEGIIVEAMLGEGLALDSYATQLQDLEVEKKKHEVAKLKAEAERTELINEITKGGSADKAEILKSLINHCCGETSININK